MNDIKIFENAEFGSVYSRMIGNISSCRVRDVEMICNVLGMDIKELLGVRA